MNREDIIRLAREAGGTDRRTGWWDIHTGDLEHLVALVTERDTALLRQALEAVKNSREYIVAEYEQRKALYEGYPHMAHKYQAEANDLASIDALITALRERLGEKV